MSSPHLTIPQMLAVVIAIIIIGWAGLLLLPNATEF